MNGETHQLLNVLEEEKRKLEERAGILERENISLREKSTSLEEKVKLLEEQLNGFLRQLYGRRSERFDSPGQQYFFSDLVHGDESGAASDEAEKVETKRRPPKKRGPKPIPDHIPRDIVRLDPDEHERTCGCCKKSMERVDELVTEELTVKPPEFRVNRIVRGKWCCEDCMSHAIAVPLPPRPIENGRPSPTLLAYIVVSKWADHLPLYRQEQIFKRYGLDLSRKTMDEWLGQLAGLLRAIVEAMKRSLLEERFLQADETPIQVLDKEVKGKSRRCYFWAYGIPAREIVYDFTESRSATGPREFLDGFSGDLQTDGYVGYNDVIERVSTHPASRVSDLTPRGWKAARERAGNEAAPAAR